MLFFIVFLNVAIVRNTEVYVLSETSARVTWDNSGYLGINEFIVYYKQTSNINNETLEQSAIVDASVNSVSNSGLVSRAEYRFEVVARAVQQVVQGSRTGSVPVLLVSTIAPSAGCGTSE